jgi:hypothetical protein
MGVCIDAFSGFHLHGWRPAVSGFSPAGELLGRLGSITPSTQLFFKIVVSYCAHDPLLQQEV